MTDIERKNSLEAARSEDGGQQSRPVDLRIPQNTKDSNQSNSSTDEDDGNHEDRLAQSRKRRSNVQRIKDVAKNASPMGAVSLLGQINLFSDMPYVAAFGAAMLKDLLDLPAAATGILPIIFAMLCSIFIFMMMLVAGSGGKKKGASALLKKSGVLIGGGVADSIPGVDFFPIESATVAVIYVMELNERKNGLGVPDNFPQDNDEDKLAA